MLHCRGGVFYTGHTDNLERRLAEHQSGLVVGFTSRLSAAELVWSQEFPTRIEALEAERRIKGWSRKKKLALIRGDWDEISRLAKGKSCPSTSSGRTEVDITTDVLAALLREAADAAPKEACGLLLGAGHHITELRPAPNIADEPRRNFEIDPRVLIAAHRAARTGGAQIVAADQVAAITAGLPPGDV
jgi:predicted GIY-YIG superfamily endonuclease